MALPRLTPLDCVCEHAVRGRREVIATSLWYSSVVPTHPSTVQRRLPVQCTSPGLEVLVTWKRARVENFHFRSLNNDVECVVLHARSATKATTDGAPAQRALDSGVCSNTGKERAEDIGDSLWRCTTCSELTLESVAPIERRAPTQACERLPR